MSPRARNLTDTLPRVRCEPELRAELDKLAVKQGRDVTFIIRAACRSHVDRETRKAAAK